MVLIRQRGEATVAAAAAEAAAEVYRAERSSEGMQAAS